MKDFRFLAMFAAAAVVAVSSVALAKVNVQIVTDPGCYVGKVCVGQQCTGTNGCVSVLGAIYRDTYYPSGEGCASTPNGSGACDQNYRPCRKSESFGYVGACNSSPNSTTTYYTNGC